LEPLLVPPCLAASDAAGCTTGRTEDRRRHGYCAKHAVRFAKYGDPYMTHVRGRKAPGETGLVPIDQAAPKSPAKGWRRFIARFRRSHGR